MPPPEEARDDCGYTTCLGCLTDPSCGSWYNSGLGCYDTCAVADASCYNTVFNADKTPEELCGIAKSDETNERNCAAQVNCGGCTATPLADGSTNCAWFQDGGYCAPPGCNMMGECGDTDPAGCPAPPTPVPVDCGSLATCGECLNADGCDAWSVGQCFASCMEAPQDVACCEYSMFANGTYDSVWIRLAPNTEKMCSFAILSLTVLFYFFCTNFPSLPTDSQEFINGTPEAICQQAENDGADDELCSMQSDCGSCTGTTLSDGASTCQWFSTDGPDGYCAAGCNMMGCGVTTCDGGNPSVLPECGEGLCADPSGACRQPGDEWFLDDACSKCTCMEEGVACVGCPLQQIPTDEGSNLSISQEGINCGGVTMDVTCTIMGDDSTACHEYLPSNSTECTVEVNYSYMVRQEAPPQNAILTSVIRQREDSYHGSPRNFVENRWGENLTPTLMATYEMSSWEGEFVNFCLKNIKPPTVL